MEMLKLLGLSFFCAAAGSLLRSYRPEMRIPFSLACLGIFLHFILHNSAGVFTLLFEKAEGVGLSQGDLKLLLKLIAMAHVVDLSADVCRDAGESALANKVETAGKLLLLSAMLPLVEQIFSILQNFGAFL